MRRAIPVAIASLLWACGGALPPTRAVNPDLHVEGNQLLYLGKPTRLLGVSHSGSEFVCIRSGGTAIFEGPDPDALAASILGWGHVNAVRLPLNEDCWLGINGVSAATGGAAYRAAVVQYASRLHAHGLFTIVDLHWSAPGAFPALGQQPMADADHAPAFWASVARAFQGDPMTVFDLFNEPFVAPSNASTTDPWACWADGCTVTTSNGDVTGSWRAAGMRDLVSAVRGAGARNVLMLGGLGYANDLTGWLAHVPSDPLGQITASFHLYNFNACADSHCWDAQIAPVAARVPVITGELGENDCGRGLLDAYLPWADAHRVSYLGWSWNPWDCSKGPALISGYDGTPTGFGQGLREHLAVTSP
jgi:endoglucanase